jgi:hypothetical protein
MQTGCLQNSVYRTHIAVSLTTYTRNPHTTPDKLHTQHHIITTVYDNVTNIGKFTSQKIKSDVTSRQPESTKSFWDKNSADGSLSGPRKSYLRLTDDKVAV